MIARGDDTMTSQLRHNLGELLDLHCSHPHASLLVAGVACDSRNVKLADLMFARSGAHFLADAAIADARQRGAVAAVVPATESLANTDLPVIRVDDFNATLGRAAARAFADPTTHLNVVGVTGTNGKTTVAQLLAQALEQLGGCGVIGTLGIGRPGALEPTVHTTPDAVMLQRAMASFVTGGARHAVMEVSSLGIAQGRAEGLKFDGAIFTNLSRDHLDYHGSMEAYGHTKAQLFAVDGLAAAVINADDTFGASLLARSSVAALGYSLNRGKNTVSAEVLSSDAHGMHLRIDGPFGHAELRAPLIGKFNVYNLLAALGMLLMQGVSLAQATQVLAEVKPVAGRMQWLGGAGGPLVVVDFAHTPDALANAIESLRFRLSGKLTCVFGCGGDRDPGKRAQMATIAESHADAVVVTDDNPRSESSDAIVADIVAGFKVPQAVHVDTDRARAVTDAIIAADIGDIVLVAGKGHEAYQERNGILMPFNDIDVARLALRARP